METTANLHTSRLTHAADSSPREEGYLHYVAREGRWALRWCIGLCILGIAIVMVTPLWFVAFVPAGVMLVCGILLVIANYVEKRSDREAHDALERTETAGATEEVIEDHAEDHRLAPAAQEIVKRESKTGLVILFVVVLAALLIAFIFLPTPVFAIGALVVFAYMLLLMAPVWLGWFNEDVEQETKRLDHAQQ